MKKLVLMILAIAGLAACSEEGPAEQFLEVNANNISGEWKVETYDGGQSFGEGIYVYVKFIRKDTRYEIYSNTSSMGQPVKTSGTFDIEMDEDLGAVINGIYDNTQGTYWNTRYTITELTADRMVWTAVDKEGGLLPDHVDVYVRTSIPQDIIDRFPAEED